MLRQTCGADEYFRVQNLPSLKPAPGSAPGSSARNGSNKCSRRRRLRCSRRPRLRPSAEPLLAWFSRQVNGSNKRPLSTWYVPFELDNRMCPRGFEIFDHTILVRDLLPQDSALLGPVTRTPEQDPPDRSRNSEIKTRTNLQKTSPTKKMGLQSCLLDTSCWEHPNFASSCKL